MKKSFLMLCTTTAVLMTACMSYGPSGTAEGPDSDAADPVVSAEAGAPAAGDTIPASGSVSGGTAESRDEAPAAGETGDVSTAGEAEEPEPAPAVSGGTRGAESGKSGDELEYFVEEGEPDAAFAGTAALPRTGSRDSRVPSSSGLSAGFADDNRQYGYFIDFLDEYAEVPHYDLDVRERVILHVKDSQGKPVANAKVSIESGGLRIAGGVTLADGTLQFNPPSSSPRTLSFRAAVAAEPGQADLEFDREGLRNIEVSLEGRRVIPDRVPLDILFILDTTGSMGEEIHRLRATIELIHLNLTSLSTNPAVRFGMVLYKDSGDEYSTRVVPLTDDLEAFRSSLDLVEASGGGDTPEDLQSALEDSLREIEWNSRGIRLGFIITDAPPHLDYGQEYTYADASMEARERGIKLFSVGTGGLPLSGEYVLRQIAQYTGGKYIFLTYGETGESEGGLPGSVSHHTGANYQTDKLEAIIIRFAKEELSYLTDEPFEQDDPYFQAVKIAGEEREKTLSKLFTMALDQLSDYSTYPLEKTVTAAILPLEPATGDLALNAEYFTEQLMLAVKESAGLTLVDRNNIEEVMNELKFQLSGLTDSDTVAEVGQLLNAQVLIAGKLYMPGPYELYFRLLRVETGEVLSVTKTIIANELGLTGR